MSGFSISGQLERVQNFYIAAEDRLVGISKQVLPQHLHELAEKVARCVPEIFCSLTLLTGIFKGAAVVYGLARTVWAVSPLFYAVFTAGDLHKARDEVASRLQASFDKFKPAIFVSFAVMAAVSLVFGFASFSPTLLLTGAFFGIISKVGYDAQAELAPKSA